MTEALEIARLTAIIEVYQQHHINCTTVTHETNALLQHSLSNLVVNFHDAQETPPFASKEQDHLLQVVLCAPDNKRKRKNSTSVRPEDKKSKSNEQASENARSARNTLLTNVNEAKDVAVPSLCIRTICAGTPFDRGRAYAQRTSQIVEDFQKKEMEARVELFLFLSCCGVLETLKVLSPDQADELMAPLSKKPTSAYLRRIRDGAAYVNRRLVSGLVKKDWKLDHATFMLASAAPPRPYWYTRIADGNHTRSTVESLHKHKPQVQDSACCLVSDYVLQWDPSLSVHQINRALGYPDICKDQTDSQSSLPSGHPSSSQTILHQHTVDIPNRLGSSVVQESGPNQLLSLLTALGARMSIPQFLLAEAGKSRRRWNSDGNLEEYFAEELGLDPLVASLLRDDRILEESLQTLESGGFLTRESERIKMLQFPNIGQSGRQQAIVLASFFFSGCEYSPKFSTIGNAALPLFQSAFHQYKALDQEQRLPLRGQVWQALLQASKFADLSWKKFCIDAMEEEGAENLDAPSKASFVVRKAFVLRSDGRWDESSTLLRECMRTLRPVDRRLNAIRGLLIYSLASNLWERENFIEADTQLRVWEPTMFMPLSLYETRAFVRILTGSALVNLHQGLFAEARDLLQRAREQYDSESSALLDVTASLADVYCELGQPSKAIDLLGPIVNSRACLNDRYSRNCYVSYAEASICLHNYELAEGVLVRLKQHYESLPKLDRHDRRRHNRVLVLLAQNLHRQANSKASWQATERRWADVVKCMQGFDESSSWDFGMVCFSMHHTFSARGETSKWYERGTTEFKSRGHFWMRGMTTYWKEFLRARLPTLVEPLGCHATRVA